MPKAVKVIIIILAALAVLGGLSFAALVFLFNGDYHITNTEGWEEITRSSYTITLPQGMRDGEVTSNDNTFTILDSYVNNKVGVIVASYVMEKEMRKITQRIDLFTLAKEMKLVRDASGKEIDLQKRNDMIYGEYTATLNGKQYMIVDAIIMSETTMYEVEVHCDPEDYEEYKTYIFAWLDSFQPLI